MKVGWALHDYIHTGAHTVPGERILSLGSAFCPWGAHTVPGERILSLGSAYCPWGAHTVPGERMRSRERIRSPGTVCAPVCNIIMQCPIMQCPTHLHNRNHLKGERILSLKRAKFTFFWQIRKFFRETSGGKFFLFGRIWTDVKIFLKKCAQDWDLSNGDNRILIKCKLSEI